MNVIIDNEDIPPIEGDDILKSCQNNLNFDNDFNEFLNNNFFLPFLHEKIEEEIIKEDINKENLIKNLYELEKKLKIVNIQLLIETRFYDRMYNLYNNNLKKYSDNPKDYLINDLNQIYFQYKTSEPHVLKYRNKIKELKKEIKEIKNKLKLDI
jgi:hypothetical protein